MRIFCQKREVRNLFALCAVANSP